MRDLWTTLDENGFLGVCKLTWIEGTAISLIPAGFAMEVLIKSPFLQCGVALFAAANDHFRPCCAAAIRNRQHTEI